MNLPLRTLLPQGSRPRARALLAAAALALALPGCPTVVRAPTAERPPKADRWFQRASAEFRQVALDAAYDSARQALDLAPRDPEILVLNAQVALARLELDEVLRLLKGVRGSQAASLRARAHWYRGDVERAAEEVDQVLADPDVEDSWAKAIRVLALAGAGRKPFDTTATEGEVAAVEMTRTAGGAPLYIVPVEINGEPVLSLVATGTSEVMLDSGSSAKPSWISMRFGRRIEVRDVPALSQDLSGLSQQLGAPIKALLGANLLRHVNATLDFRGRQFVARLFSAPPPPLASRLDVAYLRGGGMVITGHLADRDAASALLVDTSMGFSAALDDAGWKKIGLDASKLEPLPGPGPEVRQGTLASLKLGSFTVPSVPAVLGPSFDRLEKELEVDLDGALGAGLLASFRMTLAESGRVLWLEQAPSVPPTPPLEVGPGGLVGPPDGPPGAVPPSLGGGSP